MMIVIITEGRFLVMNNVEMLKYIILALAHVDVFQLWCDYGPVMSQNRTCNPCFVMTESENLVNRANDFGFSVSLVISVLLLVSVMVFLATGSIFILLLYEAVFCMCFDVKGLGLIFSQAFAFITSCPVAAALKNI